MGTQWPSAPPSMRRRRRSCRCKQRGEGGREEGRHGRKRSGAPSACSTGTRSTTARSCYRTQTCSGRKEPERPEPEWEEPEHPAPEWKEPERPAPEWEEPERPKPKRGELVRPEPKRGESVRPEPKRGESVHPEPKRGESVHREPEEVELPSREPEEVELLSREPEGEKAEVPQQPLHMLLRGAQGRRTRLRRQKVPARLQKPLEWPQPPPPMPECLEPWPLEELELPLPEWPPSPSVVPEGLSAVPEGSSSPPVVPECLPAVRVHTFQIVFSCELDDDGTTRRYWQEGYDGKDFIIYDEKTQTWTAVAPKAVYFKLRWEADPVFKQHIMDLFQLECVDWLKNYIQYGRAIVKRKVPPEVRLFQKKAGHSAGSEVTCHVTGFYPREVEVTWLRDGQGPLEEGVWSGEVLPNMDGTYQVRKTLTVSPEEQERHRYTCQVDHASLGEKMEKEWGTGSHTGIICGVVVSVLLLITVMIAGALIWKKRQAVMTSSEWYSS
ncbi:UNVERIFIED_CONTAM: hypothetical protein FKN15_026933 [Acipenser sinensis]